MMSRKISDRYLILCEGETEEIYSKSLKNTLSRENQRTVTVEVSRGSRTDPANLVNEAIRLQRKAKKEGVPYKQIWLFFDNDNHSNLREVFESISKNGFKHAYSSICLEHWFVLHYECCGKAFLNGQDAIGHLKKFWPNYHKATIDHYKHLESRLALAFDHLQRIRASIDSETPKHLLNPFFTVDELILFFAGLSLRDYLSLGIDKGRLQAALDNRLIPIAEKLKFSVKPLRENQLYIIGINHGNGVGPYPYLDQATKSQVDSIIAEVLAQLK